MSVNTFLIDRPPFTTPCPESECRSLFVSPQRRNRNNRVVRRYYFDRFAENIIKPFREYLVRYCVRRVAFKTDERIENPAVGLINGSITTPSARRYSPDPGIEWFQCFFYTRNQSFWWARTMTKITGRKKLWMAIVDGVYIYIRQRNTEYPVPS